MFSLNRSSSTTEQFTNQFFFRIMRYNGMTFDFGGTKVRQINKQTAKKNYYAGKTIFLLPCNMR